MLATMFGAIFVRFGRWVLLVLHDTQVSILLCHDGANLIRLASRPLYSCSSFSTVAVSALPNELRCFIAFDFPFHGRIL